MKQIKSFDQYLAKKMEWHDELIKLREIILQFDLEETIKWGSPVYTFQGKKVLGLGAFKSYVGIWFFQGVYLKDKKKLLVNAQENKTKALRQWRFQSTDEINGRLIAQYISEAVENTKLGKEVKPSKVKSLSIPEELEGALKRDHKLKHSFEHLTPGKQREYFEYIGQAKRETTRQSRLEKSIPLILDGKGLNDKYR